MVRRPASSQAVVRARGGANAVNPVAALLADLSPDGSWSSDFPMWHDPEGPGRRLLTAVQLGADPTDPRLHAAAEVLLETAPGEGGFALDRDQVPVAWLTARVLQALAELGWCHHARFQEGLAWLDEKAPHSKSGGWATTDTECAVTPVALLMALTSCAHDRRRELRARAVESAVRGLSELDEESTQLDHPNIDRTDVCEALWALAQAGVPFHSRIVPALASLQKQQGEGARWVRGRPEPRGGSPSRWVTLHAAVALLHFAVEAGLPRMYPQKPQEN